MPGYQYQFPQRGMVSQADAAYIEKANIPRSTFINQWTRKGTYYSGPLFPILVDEILPGDHMQYNITGYFRMATPLFPMFDSIRVDTHFFFVPNRLVWTHWVNFMGEQANPGDTTNYTIPVITGKAGGDDPNEIHDHMGIPTAGQVLPTFSLEYSALPFRAYYQIWNAWFRDENLQPSAPENRSDGFDLYSDYYLHYRNKSHDYFTSALPWPQKFTAPTIPLTNGNSFAAPVLGIGKKTQIFADGPQTVFQSGGTGSVSMPVAEAVSFTAGADNQFFVAGTSPTTGYPAIYADLTNVGGISINTLRQAWMVQTLYERDARGGTRYIESTFQQFGVRNPDYRLQRPEYIGGGSSALNITPIAQTAPTTGVPLGALGGAGTSAGQHRASYAATEHGYIIGLLSFKTELSYQQGLHKHWSRKTRLEFYVPALAQLGEQSIPRKEIFADGVTGDIIFGYQERWQEYRTRTSDIVGMMRSTTTGTIDAWHLSQKLTNTVALNSTFIVDQAPMARVLAAGVAANVQQYLGDIMYHRTATRPIPTYGTPASMGRF